MVRLLSLQGDALKDGYPTRLWKTDLGSKGHPMVLDPVPPASHPMLEVPRCALCDWPRIQRAAEGVSV